MTGNTINSEPCTIAKLESIEQLQYGGTWFVTIGKSPLVWVIDDVKWGNVRINRQVAGRVSVRNFTYAEALERLNAVIYPTAVQS